MGDTFNNYGQVGAMGKKAVAFQNTFSQEDRKTLETISEQDLAKLKVLINKLMDFDEAKLRKAEALRGAACLLEIIEAYQSSETETQVEALGKWRLWVNGLKEVSLGFLAVTADILTVSLPVLKLLGLSTL
ncbi:hypothetical protein [Paenibacillus tundrae]|uniref:hypothetical protein n=1 Tax=Paenibacillus tundrae TaxID=528187 RepID=UPI0022A9A0C4|nr:hypothetical protein [Paenibacillus tundrae]MCZ1268967.1 hypothetical protein [Paenibacillus tundrae]